MHPGTISHKGEKLHVLKCDFHAHFIEFKSDPAYLLGLMRRHGYDVVTLSEHNNLVPGFVMERLYAEKARQEFGRDFLVLVAEEVTADDSANSGHRSTHILSLFPEFHIDTLMEKDPPQVLPVAEVIPILRQAGGLLCINHDIFSNYYSDQPLKTRWACRQAYDVDGWEVGNGSVGDWFDSDKNPTTPQNNLCHEDPQAALAEGYFLLSNTDFHGDEPELMVRKDYYNVVFARERSVAAIREALEARRNVAIAGERQIGTADAMELYRHATC